jgi:mannose-6-phosphate isomerase-like protein (cupin superfamily)
MTDFDTMMLPRDVTVTAPDGGDVRVLLALAGGSFAHFALDPGKTSIAVTHRTVEEIWYVVSGRGEMWRRQGGRQEVVTLEPGVCLTIPLGTRFQFRSFGPDTLGAVAITMPPWPADREEAYRVEGKWTAEL